MQVHNDSKEGSYLFKFLLLANMCMYLEVINAPAPPPRSTLICMLCVN
jgi:hypothetical protein